MRPGSRWRRVLTAHTLIQELECFGDASIELASPGYVDPNLAISTHEAAVVWRLIAF
jgi:hypothetical protein